jgi:branched-chain amino acid transport system permease protein
MEYVLHIVVIAGIYAVLASSLDILAGHAGLLSLSQAAFFGFGAYTSALLALHGGVSFPISMSLAAGVASIVSLIVSITSMRLRGDYFVLATFAFQMIFFALFNNWIAVTSGPLGIASIPPPDVFGWMVQSRAGFACLSTILVVCNYIIVGRIVGSPFGRLLHAVREDEVYLATLGRDAFWVKVKAFAVSAGLAGAAGSIYAHYMSYIDPSSFTILESILILSMLIIGGAGSIFGSLVGATILVLLPEVLRFVGLPTATAANLRSIIYGVLVIIMIMFRPRGIVGRFGFGR